MCSSDLATAIRSEHAEIRSSPVYAGHTIKPLRKLHFRAGACSLGQDRGDRRTDLPCGISRAERSLFLPSHPDGYPQKEFWPSPSLSGCTHRRASCGRSGSCSRGCWGRSWSCQASRPEQKVDHLAGCGQHASIGCIGCLQRNQPRHLLVDVHARALREPGIGVGLCDVLLVGNGG